MENGRGKSARSIDKKPPNPNERWGRKTERLFDYVIDENVVDEKPPNLIGN